MLTSSLGSKKTRFLRARKYHWYRMIAWSCIKPNSWIEPKGSKVCDFIWAVITFSMLQIFLEMEWYYLLDLFNERWLLLSSALPKREIMVCMTSKAPTWRRFERLWSSNSDKYESERVGWEDVYLVSTSNCVGEVESDCFLAFSIFRWSAFASRGFPSCWRTRSCFIVELSSNAIKDKSTCTLDSEVLSFLTMVPFDLLGIVISETRFFGVRCLRTSLDSLFKSTFD